jgi:hypothetical protein
MTIIRQLPTSTTSWSCVREVINGPNNWNDVFLDEFPLEMCTKNRFTFLAEQKIYISIFHISRLVPVIFRQFTIYTLLIIPSQVTSNSDHRCALLISKANCSTSGETRHGKTGTKTNQIKSICIHKTEFYILTVQ